MYKKGFTLVELLVVIAIIGILSSVVFASLSSARGKARTAASQQTMGSLNALLNICRNEAVPVNITSPAVGGDICGANDAGATFPALPANWTYGCGVDAPAQDITINDGSDYTVCAGSATDASEVTCTSSGCVRDGAI